MISRLLKLQRPCDFLLLSSLFFLSQALRAAEAPEIPVGLDAYRQWERWPYQRIGARAYMRSTYDRRGGNEGADASHFLYQLADDFNVTLDVEGSGILYFARYNHWHGSPWHYVVDGTDHVVKETSTADPIRPVADSASRGVPRVGRAQLAAGGGSRGAQEEQPTRCPSAGRAACC